MFFELKKFIQFWLMPLPFCFSAMIVGYIMLRWTRLARLGRALLVGGIVLLMLFSNKIVSRWLIRPLETRYPAIPELPAGAPLPADLAACRYVVVLGGGNGYSPGVSANNLLSTSSLSRIAEAIRLLRALPEAKLIVSGPRPGNEPVDSHATVLARTAQIYGIAPERILHIEHANDTEEEARATQQIAQGARVALVTSAWHLPRAMALFHNAGLDPLPCPADFHSHAGDQFYYDHLLWDANALERSTFAVHERIGYLWIWLRGKT